MSNGVVNLTKDRDWETGYIPPLPPYPTDALPGSAEKVQVMRQRNLMGYHIHHPNDAKRSTDELSESRLRQAVQIVQLIAEIKGH